MNPVEYVALKYLHKNKHYNKLFYSLTPALQVATVRAFKEVYPYLMRLGAYYEFGVFKGYNLWFAHKLQPFIQCYGFDSFAGMPAKKGSHPHHSKGMYGASVEEVKHHLETHRADMKRITLVEGFFSDTMFAAVQDMCHEDAAVVVVDCDLYTSAVPVLRFLGPRLKKGSIVLFDDYYMEPPSEATAWEEFKKKNGVSDIHLFDFGDYGCAVRVEV